MGVGAQAGGQRHELLLRIAEEPLERLGIAVLDELLIAVLVAVEDR